MSTFDYKNGVSNFNNPFFIINTNPDTNTESKPNLKTKPNSYQTPNLKLTINPLHLYLTLTPIPNKNLNLSVVISRTISLHA